MAEGLHDEGALRGLMAELGASCALLRHGLPDFERGQGSDWDLVARDPAAAQAALERRFGEPLASVRRSYVVMNHYRWGQVDLLPGFEVRGIQYLDSGRFWSRVGEGDDGIRRPCLAHEAFLAWMTGVLAGGNFKERYLPLLARAVAEDGDEFRGCLEEAFGEHRAAVLWAMAVEGRAGDACAMQLALQRDAFSRRAMRSPFRLVAEVARHGWREARLHLRAPMPVIAFLGPDGSGKSTVIEGVESAVRGMRLRTKLLHWRPQCVAGNAGDGSPVTDPHAKPPRGVAESAAKLLLLAADWWVAWLGPLLHLRSKVCVVLCDRFYGDLLVDPRRYRYGAPLSWARKVFGLMPKPDRVLVLLADAPTILARKQEVTAPELERQLAAYRELAASMGDRAVVLDAGQPAEAVVARAVEVVMGEISRRSAGRRNW